MMTMLLFNMVQECIFLCRFILNILYIRFFINRTDFFFACNEKMHFAINSNLRFPLLFDIESGVVLALCYIYIINLDCFHL